MLSVRSRVINILLRVSDLIFDLAIWLNGEAYADCTYEEGFREEEEDTVLLPNDGCE